MDKNEQYIINACVANDPSIVELKEYVCKVSIGQKIRTVVVINYGNGDIKVDRYKHWFSRDEFEILGRDIFIGDVLGAIGKNRFNEIWQAFADADCYRVIDMVLDSWNLKKPLHKQTEETKLLIAKILGFKE